MMNLIDILMKGSSYGKLDISSYINSHPYNFDLGLMVGLSLFSIGLSAYALYKNYKENKDHYRFL